MGVDHGFDALEGRFGDMVEMGIIDPLRVVRSALQNGASVGRADPDHQLAGGRGADAVEQGADDRVRAAGRGHPAAVAGLVDAAVARPRPAGRLRRCTPVGGRTFPVVDAQVHVWDASPHNQAAPAGESYAIDVLRRHRELDGSGVPRHDVERVSEHSLNRDVFGDGHVDRAVLQPVVLGDLFVLGFSPLEWHAEMAGWMPDRFVLSGELDPSGGQPGARGLTPACAGSTCAASPCASAAGPPAGCR
jgi:hypothetical protein